MVGDRVIRYRIVGVFGLVVLLRLLQLCRR